MLGDELGVTLVEVIADSLTSPKQLLALSPALVALLAASKLRVLASVLAPY